LAIAREADLPVILHTRDAAADTLELIDRFPDLAGVAHCFTGDADFAQALVERGWMISFSGILTFPSAGYLRDLAACVPEDRLLIETDAPFLSPVPFRGQTNFPSRVMHTAAVLADIRGVSLERIAALTAENGQRFFSHNRSAQRV
jgi:TatD DNase family protein